MKVEVPTNEVQTQTEASSVEKSNPTKKTSKEIIAYLADKFPLCFTVDGACKPLKIGIFTDLAARLEGDSTVSKTQLRVALRQYTNSWRYLKSTQAGVERVDIDGQAAGIVEEEHALHAKETLVASQQKVQAARQKRSLKAKEAAERTKKQTQAKKSPRKTQARVKKSKPTQPSIQLKGQVNPETLKLGAKVALQLGNKPVVATLTTLDKQEAQVQLDTGLTVKVALSELREI